MSGDTTTETFERILRMLSDPITAPAAWSSIAAVTRIDGIPPAFAERIHTTLDGARHRARNESESHSIEATLAQLPALERRGQEREPERQHEQAVTATLEWLHRNMGTRWRREDASDLVRYMGSMDEARRQTGAEAIRSQERLVMAQDFLWRPRYVNHCWFCQTEINSRFDTRCSDCERYYICSKCRRCYHHNPDAPSVSELRANAQRLGPSP